MKNVLFPVRRAVKARRLLAGDMDGTDHQERVVSALPRMGRPLPLRDAPVDASAVACRLHSSGSLLPEVERLRASMNEARHAERGGMRNLTYVGDIA